MNAHAMIPWHSLTLVLLTLHCCNLSASELEAIRATDREEAMRTAALEARIAALEKDLHQHEHDHNGVFAWSGAFELTSLVSYSWSFLRVGEVYGANETTMHVAIVLTDESRESFASHGPDDSPAALRELDGDQLDELHDATTLCASRAVRWEEGVGSMESGVCYKVAFDQTDDDTILTVEVEESGVYAIFTEYVPSDFAADGGMMRAGGERVLPLATALVKGLSMRTTDADEDHSMVGEFAQDAVSAAALAFGLIGLVLGAGALCVACQAKQMANRGTPTFGAVGGGVSLNANAV